MTIEITKVMDSNQRANIVKEVLLDLPEWLVYLKVPNFILMKHVS